MPIRGLRRRFYPRREGGDFACIREEGEWLRCICLHSHKECLCLGNVQSVHGHTRNHPDKSNLRHGRRKECGTALRPYPIDDSLMELMLSDTEGDERIHVQKVSHGKSVSSSLTISLVRIGASGPRSIAVNPVT